MKSTVSVWLVWGFRFALLAYVLYMLARSFTTP